MKKKDKISYNIVTYKFCKWCGERLDKNEEFCSEKCENKYKEDEEERQEYMNYSIFFGRNFVK